MRCIVALHRLLPLVLLLAPVAAHAQTIEGIELDADHLPEASVDLVRADFELLKKLPIDAPAGSRFVRVFGGGDAQSVWSYLLERVHYIGAEISDAEGVDATEDSGSEGSLTFASNYGPSFFDYLYQLRYKKKRKHTRYKAVRLPFRDTKIAITSPRTGFVVLGKGYNTKDLGPLGRIETWVHEARHSDCAETPPATAAGREQIRSFLNDEFAQLKPETLACTNVHVPCPKGHPMEGEEACDRHAWGAYMIGAVFAEGILKHCKACEPALKKEALELLTDNRSRFLGTLIGDWDKDRLPKPVMESVR